MNQRHVILSIIFVAILILASAGYLLWTETNTDSEPTETTNSQPAMTQEEAIRQAENYEPDTDVICTQALTDAVHPETGAEYTFPTGCLAPGWEAKPDQNTL